MVGAGIIGCAIAQALAAQGRQVLLLDRAGPAIAGASFGNVGHIATEQVETLPSKQLLLGFWRQLFAFDGALDIPLHRVMSLSPWLARFAVAAFRQGSNTRHLAPLVRDGADSLERLLGAIGRRDLMRRNGHYAVWLGAGAAERAAREATNAARLGVRTAPAPVELLRSIAAMTSNASAASLWFPDSAHVLDPAEVARALAINAIQRGASVERAEVRQLQPVGSIIDITTDTGRVSVPTVIVCAGAWSASLLAPFGLRAPLEAERGYHIELPGHLPLTDAPLVYADQKVAITPMTGRLRASSYLEFAGLACAAGSTQTGAPARQTARVGISLRCRGPELDGVQAHAAGLPAWHRPPLGNAQSVLCGGTPTPRTHPRRPNRGS